MKDTEIDPSPWDLLHFVYIREESIVTTSFQYEIKLFYELENTVSYEKRVMPHFILTLHLLLSIKVHLLTFLKNYLFIYLLIYSAALARLVGSQFPRDWTQATAVKAQNPNH